MVQTVANGIVSYAFSVQGVRGLDAAGSLVQLFPFVLFNPIPAPYVGNVSGLTYPAGTTQIASLDVSGAYALGYTHSTGLPANLNPGYRKTRSGATTNSPVSLQCPPLYLYYGQVTTTATGTTLTASAATWSTNQWVGYVVMDMTTGAVSTITANAATTLTLASSLVQVSGDNFGIFAAGTVTPPRVVLNSTETITSAVLRLPILFFSGGNTPAQPNYTDFSFSRSNPAIFSTTAPQAALLTGQSVSAGATAGVYSTQAVCVSFLHEGPSKSCEFNFFGSSNVKFTIKVDDQYLVAPNVTITAIPGNSGFANYVTLTFPTEAKRRIDLYISNGGYLYSVNCGPNDSIEPAPIRGPKAIIITDSFGTTGATNLNGNCMAQVMADCLGWDNVWISGVGGTGYVTPGTGLTFRQRLQTDVINFGPFDVVLWLGGHNDTYSTLASQATIAAEAQLCYQQVQAAMPNAQQIVFGVNVSGGQLSNGTAGSATLIQGDAGLAQAAATIGIPFISEINQIRNFAQQGGGNTATISGTITNGATSFTVTQASGIFSNGNQLALPCNVIIGSGATAQVVRVASLSGATYTLATGYTLQAQTAGAQVAQYGESVLTGTGHVAGTTGYGNADIYVGADGTHPTDLGHLARGKWMAAQIAALGLN